MTKMGAYCKAIPVKMLRQYAGWQENLENLRTAQDPEEQERRREGLSDEDFLYLQEDFTVTDGVFLEEHVIFGSSASEWREYCRVDLSFDPEVARNTSE